MTRALRVEVPRAFVPLLEPHHYKGAHGGRGSAKSHFFAGQASARGYFDRNVRIVCIREVQRSLKLSSKLLIEDKIRALGLEHGYRILNDEIQPRGGSGIIVFQGMQNHTAESIKSLEGFDVAWIEEAQALSARSLRLLRATIRKPGSEIWASWNPRHATDPIDDLFRGGEPPPDSVCIRANWQDNPWFPDELRREMLYDYRRDPEMAAHTWGGDYEEHSEARVFKNWRVEEFESPTSGVAFLLGADWGFSVDPSVLVRAFVQGRTLYIDHEAYEVGCPIDRTPFLFGGTEDPELHAKNPAAWAAIERTRKRYEGVPDARRWLIVADSARPETIDYMKRHGFPKMEKARKGPGSVEEGVEFLQSYDIVVHPRCRHVTDELTHYSYKTDPDTEEVLPELADKKNNTIDAIRYAVERLRLKRKRAGAW